MNFTVKLLIISLSCVLPAFVAAQQSPPPITQAPQRDPQALQLLQQSYRSMGAAGKSSILDAEARGQLFELSDLGNPVGSFIAKVRGEDFSMAINRNGFQSKYAVLNGRGSLSKNGQLKPLASYNTEGLSLDLIPLFAKWTEFGSTQAYIGPPTSATVDGTVCFEIHITLPSQSDLNDHGKIDVFISQASGLVFAIRYVMTMGPHQHNKVLVENRFSDYQSFGPILVPTSISRYVNGTPRAVLRIGELRTNNGFTDSDFQN